MEKILEHILLQETKPELNRIAVDVQVLIHSRAVTCNGQSLCDLAATAKKLPLYVATLDAHKTFNVVSEDLVNSGIQATYGCSDCR